MSDFRTESGVFPSRPVTIQVTLSTAAPPSAGPNTMAIAASSSPWASAGVVGIATLIPGTCMNSACGSATRIMSPSTPIIRTGEPCTTSLVIQPDTLVVGNTATMTATVMVLMVSPGLKTNVPLVAT